MSEFRTATKPSWQASVNMFLHTVDLLQHLATSQSKAKCRRLAANPGIRIYQDLSAVKWKVERWFETKRTELDQQQLIYIYMYIIYTIIEQIKPPVWKPNHVRRRIMYTVYSSWLMYIVESWNYHLDGEKKTWWKHVQTINAVIVIFGDHLQSMALPYQTHPRRPGKVQHILARVCTWRFCQNVFPGLVDKA